jgi:hypothetical protein
MWGMAGEGDRVRERQRALGIPEAFEWVHDVTPGLRAAVEASGLVVHTYPLMVLDHEAALEGQPLPPEGVAVRLVGPEEPDVLLRQLDAAAQIGFAAAGTAAGEAGVEAVPSPGSSESSAEAAE